MTPQTRKTTDQNPASPSFGRQLFFKVIFFICVQIGCVLVFFARRQSWEQSHRLALWLSRRVEPLTRKRRWSNYRTFFGAAKSEAEMSVLDENHTLYLARMRADVAAAFARSPAELKATTEVTGLENLEQTLAHKRGLMLASGHVATWWLVPSVLSSMGFPVTVIFTAIQSKALEKRLLELTGRFGVKVAFVGRDALRAMKEARQKNEIIYLTFDVSVRPKNFTTHHFGRARLVIDSGPAVLAVRNDTPLMYAECLHLDHERRQIRLLPPREIELAPQARSAEAISALWTERLLDEITARPEQWWPWGYVNLLPPVENPPKPD